MSYIIFINIDHWFIETKTKTINSITTLSHVNLGPA